MFRDRIRILGHRHGIVSASLVSGFVLMAAACGGESSAASAPDGAEARSAAATSSGETAPARQSVEAPEVLVYKSPTCGCCEGWVEHLREEGFQVRVEDRNDVEQIKDLMGIPRELRSCHTAQVGDYLVEGHVPASDIEKLLAESPEVAGLAVPGMPIGSPGMEVPGRAADRYEVFTFDAYGETEVFSSH